MNSEFIREHRLLWLIMAASFLTPFTGSALSLSLPDIGRQYGQGPESLSWVLGSFLISAFVFLLPMGRLAERWGKARLFMLGAGIFALTSFTCIFADSLSFLIGVRVVQGMGSAMNFATNNALLMLAYPKEKRGGAMGWMIAMVYVGLSLGPVVGGGLNHYLGWQSIFVFIGFIALGVFLAAPVVLREVPGADARGGRAGLLPLEAFKERTFTYSSLAALLNYMATFAVSFLLSFYLQDILGYPSHESGLFLLLQPVMMALLSPAMGALSDRIHPQTLAAWGMTLIAAGLLGLGALVHFGGFYGLFPCLLLLGVGFALFAAPNNNAVMGSVPKKFYSFASSWLGMVRLSGQVVSILIVTALLSLSHGSLAGAELLSLNMQISFVVLSFICLLGVWAARVR